MHLLISSVFVILIVYIQKDIYVLLFFFRYAHVKIKEIFGEMILLGESAKKIASYTLV